MEPQVLEGQLLAVKQRRVTEDWVKEGGRSRVVRAESKKAEESRISKCGSRIKGCGRVTEKVDPLSTAV